MTYVKNKIIRVTSRLQLAIAAVTFFMLRLLINRPQKGYIVVGAETSSILKNISQALPGAISVNLAPNPFYDFNYDYELYPRKGVFKFIRLIKRAYYLGLFSAKYKKFIYLGSGALVSPYIDGREGEFNFLCKRKNEVICYFLGSEIRSFKLMLEFGDRMQIDLITTYQSISSPDIASIEQEHRRMLLGLVADNYASKIFNPSVDQMAYIKRECLPFYYFVPDELFDTANFDKFDNPNEIIVLHGPSSPLIKGTPLVRAAVKKLKEEGYRFNYLELINVPHVKVIDSLKNAHVVLNEFYAFVPGVFGLEAMACKCALLTSGTRSIEGSLPEGADSAWLVTPYWNIYENLKFILDNPVEMKRQAQRGFEWSYRNYLSSISSKKMRDYIDD
ncbi:hypothetical protein [Shewanella algae]|uniref:hypothetical protein n=1 Tax=Shewanella algae TaxID=38313 RepID=UPI0031F4AA9D